MRKIKIAFLLKNNLKKIENPLKIFDLLLYKYVTNILKNMISNYKSEQIWEAMEILFPNDIDMFISHCNKEFEWDYHKDIFDIIETLSDDAFINEVEMVFSQDDIFTMESWLNTEYNIN